MPGSDDTGKVDIFAVKRAFSRDAAADRYSQRSAIFRPPTSDLQRSIAGSDEIFRQRNGHIIAIYRKSECLKTQTIQQCATACCKFSPAQKSCCVLDLRIVCSKDHASFYPIE